MALKNMIYKIRTDKNMSQEQFADAFGVSRQAVQKWETGAAYPEIPKIIELSKRFDISLDSLLLDRDMRAMEEMKPKDGITPNYAAMHAWELYVSAVLDEYQQSVDEGLDIETYKDIFLDISRLPNGDIKKKFGDVIFDIVTHAKQKEGYKYTEPSELAHIKSLRKPYKALENNDCKNLEEKIYGAWTGRVCGCLLGKTVEGIRTDELIPFLKETKNYPMHRYILKKDVDGIDTSNYQFGFNSRPYADEIDAMPVDDDTNYTVLAQTIIEDYGRSFTPRDVSQAWLKYQAKDAYCTAERVAFCNFVKGYEPPYSAVYKNPYREWIGAQIRTDYYGYINPGNPELAAEMAWRDASISHVKNGIYGAMFVSAMIAAAAVTNNMEEIILTGLAEIPYTSRLYEDILFVLNSFQKGVPQKECVSAIYKKYDEHTGYGWCHTIPNAMIVVASLLYGNGDYGTSICMSVQAGFDTDCNGATVGSILGMANGIKSIPESFRNPIHDTLHTSIFEVDTVSISDRAKMTMAHVKIKKYQNQ